MNASQSQLTRHSLAVPYATRPVNPCTALCGPSTSSGIDSLHRTFVLVQTVAFLPSSPSSPLLLSPHFPCPLLAPRVPFPPLSPFPLPFLFTPSPHPLPSLFPPVASCLGSQMQTMMYHQRQRKRKVCSLPILPLTSFLLPKQVCCSTGMGTGQGVSTRQWAENNGYDPVMLFHKVHNWSGSCSLCDTGSVSTVAVCD